MSDGIAITLYALMGVGAIVAFVWVTDPDFVREIGDLVMFWIQPY